VHFLPHSVYNTTVVQLRRSVTIRLLWTTISLILTRRHIYAGCTHHSSRPRCCTATRNKETNCDTSADVTQGQLIDQQSVDTWPKVNCYSRIQLTDRLVSWRTATDRKVATVWLLHTVRGASSKTQTEIQFPGVKMLIGVAGPYSIMYCWRAALFTVDGKSHWPGVRWSCHQLHLPYQAVLSMQFSHAHRTWCLGLISTEVTEVKWLASTFSGISISYTAATVYRFQQGQERSHLATEIAHMAATVSDVFQSSWACMTVDCGT